MLSSLVSLDALEKPWVPVWFCVGQTNESDLAIRGVPVVFFQPLESFPPQFLLNHCLYFIYLSNVTHSCSLLSNALLCFLLIYSGEVKPQFFFALAFFSYSVLVYLCRTLSS